MYLLDWRNRTMQTIFFSTSKVAISFLQQTSYCFIANILLTLKKDLLERLYSIAAYPITLSTFLRTTPMSTPFT